eukprot:g40248.t1
MERALAPPGTRELWRVRSALLRIQFQDRLQTASELVQSYHDCAKAVQNSLALRQCMSAVLALGNSLNAHTRDKGGAYAFHPAVLGRLQDLRDGLQPSKNLVHFLVELLRESFPTAVATLQTELAPLSQKLPPERHVQDSVLRLQKEVAQVAGMARQRFLDTDKDSGLYGEDEDQSAKSTELKARAVTTTKTKILTSVVTTKKGDDRITTVTTEEIEETTRLLPVEETTTLLPASSSELVAAAVPGPSGGIIKHTRQVSRDLAEAVIAPGNRSRSSSVTVHVTPKRKNSRVMSERDRKLVNFAADIKHGLDNSVSLSRRAGNTAVEQLREDTAVEQLPHELDTFAAVISQFCDRAAGQVEDLVRKHEAMSKEVAALLASFAIEPDEEWPGLRETGAKALFETLRMFTQQLQNADRGLREEKRRNEQSVVKSPNSPTLTKKNSNSNRNNNNNNSNSSSSNNINSSNTTSSSSSNNDNNNNNNNNNNKPAEQEQGPATSTEVSIKPVEQERGPATSTEVSFKPTEQEQGPADSTEAKPRIRKSALSSILSPKLKRKNSSARRWPPPASSGFRFYGALGEFLPRRSLKSAEDRDAPSPFCIHNQVMTVCLVCKLAKDPPPPGTPARPKEQLRLRAKTHSIARHVTSANHSAPTLFPSVSEKRSRSSFSMTRSLSSSRKRSNSSLSGSGKRSNSFTVKPSPANEAKELERS